MRVRPDRSMLVNVSVSGCHAAKEEGHVRLCGRPALYMVSSARHLERPNSGGSVIFVGGLDADVDCM